MRECDHLDSFFFDLRNEKDLPPPIPNQQELGTIFRQLSLLKCLLRPSQYKGLLGKTDKKYCTYLYLSVFTSLGCEFFEKKVAPQIDFEKLKKNTRSLKKRFDEISNSSWSDFVKKNYDVKPEILAAVYAFCSDIDHQAADNSNDSIMSVVVRRLKDPVAEFESSVSRVRRMQASKASK